MNYREAKEYVKQIQVGAKIKPGLEVTGKLMQLLGDPQAGLSFVHVAGTSPFLTVLTTKLRLSSLPDAPDA